MTSVGDDVLASLDMFGVTARFPEQVAQAATVAAGIEGLPPAEQVDNVLVLGMGGSGIAGDVLAAVGGPFVPVPIVVAKGYAPPAFVGPGTLCFAVSFSGNTEETLEAAQAAVTAGARMVVVSAGGELGALAPRWQAPLVPLPADTFVLAASKHDTAVGGGLPGGGVAATARASTNSFLALEYRPTASAPVVPSSSPSARSLNVSRFSITTGWSGGPPRRGSWRGSTESSSRLSTGSCTA